jgi:hypothetical protein
MCAVVAISSVNTSAFAEAMSASEAAEEALAAASGAVTSDAGVEAASEALGTKLLSFAAEGARVYVDGARVTNNVEVDAEKNVEVVLEARGGYALPASATLVTNVEDPVLTAFAVKDGKVTIPAGTLTTDGTLNVECTLTGEPVEEDDVAATVTVGGTEVDAEGNAVEDEAEKSVEDESEEDLQVSLEDLTNAEVDATVEQVGDGASDLRYTLEAANGAPLGAENLTSSDATGSTVLTTPEQQVPVVDVVADVENPAFEGYAYVAGAVIKVTAGEGVLPEGTTVEATLVEDEASLAAMLAVMGEEYTLEAATLFDITLRDAAGNEVQPTAAVNVAIFDAFTGESLSDDASPLVFHVSDDASEVELITARQADAAVQSFDVEHFSMYGLVVGATQTAYVTAGVGTAASPFQVFALSSATIKCTNTSEDHVHNFTTTPMVSGGKQYILYDIIHQEEIDGEYYCVIQMSNISFSGTNAISKKYYQKLYCGGETEDNATVIMNVSCPATVYGLYDVDLDGVKMGTAMGGIDRGIAPTFNNVSYAARGYTYYGLYYYWYVGVEPNELLYYWDSYRVLVWSHGPYSGILKLDYTDLQNLGLGYNTDSTTWSKIAPEAGTLNLLKGANSAEGYGYLASASYKMGTFGPYMPQYYFKVRSKAVQPTEQVTVNTDISTSNALKPGDTVTFSVKVEPEKIDLVTDTLSDSTVLTKTSTVTVKTAANETTSDAITTSNAEVEATAAGSDYTLSTLYTKEDPNEAHEHEYAYVITREDCIQALKKRKESNKTSGTMELDLTPSTTTVYDASVKVNGTSLDTSSTSNLTHSTVTATIAEEHYVNYEVTYKNAPSADTSTYPTQIQKIEDKHPEFYGNDDRTPFWEGDIIEFSGYSVGQIVEDKEAKGYWVFSGWKYNGEYVTSDLTMGTSDITVVGEWTYVTNNIEYEMSSWDYDGTYHPATTSYAGNAQVNTPTTPSEYEYYIQDENGDFTVLLGSEHPVDAGMYKVKAIWNYVVTNDDKIAGLNKPSTSDTEAGEDAGTTADTTDTIVKESTFEIRKVNVDITSGSAEKYYDGYPLTNSTIAYNGTWIAREQAQIEVVALGTQTVGNDGDGEELTSNLLVVLPALAEDAGEAATALTQKVRDELVYEAKVAAGLITPSEDEDAGESDGSGNGNGDLSDEDQAAAEAAAAELAAARAAFSKLLANYNITKHEGTLTVKHRSGDNLLPLTVVGTTPEEGLTYNGKLQTVTGYTANGQASVEGDEGAQEVLFTLDTALVEAANAGKGGMTGAQAGVYQEYVTPEADDSAGNSGDLLGDAENNGEAGDGESAEGDAAAEPLVWTMTGVSASGSGKDVATEGDGTYPVTITQAAEGYRIYDEQGLDVTHEFAVSLQDGKFAINPIELTLTSKSVTRGYDTTTLRAQEYEVTGAGFARGESLDASRIDWGESYVRRVGKVQNWFSIDSAWTGNTKPSNYNITLEFGWLEVTASTEVSERLDAVVTANSKQYETTGKEIVLSGFTKMDGSYATFEVESDEGVSTLYVEGLTAVGRGTDPGSYTVEVTGEPTIWDSKDVNDRFDVTECFNLSYYNGTLRIRAEGENGVEFTNRAELSGKTYDGKVYAPTVDALQEGTVVYFSTEAAAEKDLEHASWSTTVPTFTNVGETTVYAYGLLNGEKTEVEQMTVVIKKRTVTLASDSASKPYDGLALTASTTPKPASGSLGWVAKDLEQLEITATGSQKIPGASDNTIEVAARGEFESAEEAQEALEAVLANYELNKKPGTLAVESLSEANRIALAITGSTGTQLVYNGQEQQVTTFAVNGVQSEEIDIAGDELGAPESEMVQAATVVATVDEDGVVGEPGAAPSDEDATTVTWTVRGVDALGKATNVKVDTREPAGEGEEELDPFDLTYPVEVSLQAGGLIVIDEDGNDVSSQFAPTLSDGSFEITRRPVTITSKSAAKTYDLMTLTYNYYSVSGTFATGEGIVGDNIEWTASRTSPGTTSNTFSIANAYKEGTDPNNYAITLAFGTLTVNHITTAADKFELTVKSKSDKQRLSEGEDGESTAITITGFENEIVVNGQSYIPVNVTRSGAKATFYVTNLTATATGSERGSYDNVIKGTPLVYDSMDFATRVSVTPSVNVTTIAGKLKLYGPLDDILLWTNEFDDAEKGIEGIDGTYYDGVAKTPTVVSKYYAADSDTPTTVYYTTNEAKATKVENGDYSDLYDVVSAENNGEVEATAEGDADPSTGWVTTVPTFTDAGTYTFYAVGVRDDNDELESDTDEDNGTSGDTDVDTGSGNEGVNENENARNARTGSSDDANDPQVHDGKRYTELEDFSLTIYKRPVTLTSKDASKTYDGEVLSAPSEVTILGEDGKGFVGDEAELLELSASGEFIVPGSYNATINVTLKSDANEEEEGDSAALLGRASSTGTSVDDLLNKNYQVLKQGGLIVIEDRVGDEQYHAVIYMPSATYEWAEANISAGRLYAMSEYGENADVEQTLYEGTTKSNGYIQASNGKWYELNSYTATFTLRGVGVTDLTDPVVNAKTYTTIKNTGAIYQVNRTETENENGEKTVTYTRVSDSAVTNSFNVDLSLGVLTCTQGGGNAITSTPEWTAANTADTGYAAAVEALSQLYAWSTWTFTGEAAPEIPAVTTYKSAKSAATQWYSLDVVAPVLAEDATAEEIEAANVAAAEAATWYSWADMQNLLVAAGDYSLSVKATTTTYRDCYAFDLLTVKIIPKTLNITGDDVTVYDPTMSGYDFTYDDRGNLLDEDGNVVADSDGNLTSGTISGLPAGPAAIYSPEISYNGSTQEVKPVIVDESGYVLTEGVDYYIEYEGDTTNVGTVIMHVTSLSSGSFNFSFDLSYEIVASTNGNLKAQEVYYYTYQGDVFDEPSIVANYGGSNVIYSLNGVEYETWEAVVEEMINAGSYTLAIKADDTNYVAVDGTVVINVQPLDMTETPQESVESVEIEAPEANTLYVENTQFTYNGEHQEPSVLIVDTYGNELLKGRDYTTSIEKASTARSNSWAKSVDESIEGGTYTLCVNYRGNYTGTSRVVYNIDKITGNEVIEPEDGFTGMVEGDAEPGFTTTQPGSNLSYSVDGGAFVTWDQAQSQLTPGTHTVVIKVTNPSFEDVISDTYTITVSERPVSDSGSNTGSTGSAAGTTGSSSSSSSTGSGSNTSGSSTSTGRTVTAAGSSSTSTNAATAAATEDTPAEAVTVDSTASTSSDSAGTSTTADVAAEAAVTHATVMYLTIAILTGLLLTAAYSATVIKQRLDEAEELSA